MFFSFIFFVMIRLPESGSIVQWFNMDVGSGWPLVVCCAYNEVFDSGIYALVSRSCWMILKMEAAGPTKVVIESYPPNTLPFSAFERQLKRTLFE